MRDLSITSIKPPLIQHGNHTVLPLLEGYPVVSVTHLGNQLIINSVFKFPGRVIPVKAEIQCDNRVPAYADATKFKARLKKTWAYIAVITVTLLQCGLAQAVEALPSTMIVVGTIQASSTISPLTCQLAGRW